MIYAPYNFVPLSEKVFFPDWSSQISHDIPFSDGCSGMIKMKIKAVTPIFVRNGHTPEDKDNLTDQYVEFSHTPDGRYFIPATSIKGMVRNILEISSFGKMSQITSKRYSLRDLQLPAYTRYFRNHEVHCGWMVVDEQKGIATISDNGVPRRISADEIDSRLHIGLHDFVREKKGYNLTETRNRYAKAKYNLAKNAILEGRFSEYYGEDDNKVDNRMKVQFSSDGKPGTIVFTGQPGRRKDKKDDQKASGKFYEFVFFDKVYNEYVIPLHEEGGLYEDFCFIYEDSDDWKFWRKQTRMPVFFTLAKDKLEYMGLSYMFRLPTKKHIHNFLGKDHLSKQFDLAECIFGTIGDTSLKGRVQFSHAFCTSEHPQIGAEVRPYMGSPKPSYYPIYTQQKSDGQEQYSTQKYKTFLDGDAKLRGWKRYPVRKKNSEVTKASEGQDQNTSPFKPLLENTEFEFSIRYHNLRKVELGALLFALCPFENCLFSLGFCKPFGYGVVSMDITSMTDDEVDQLKQDFLLMMCSNIDNYERSAQLRELRAMMMASSPNASFPLKYIDDPKEFASQKKKRQFLPNYSDIRIVTSEEKASEKKRLEKMEQMRMAREKAAEEAAEKARQEQELADQQRIAKETQDAKDRKLNAGFYDFINEVFPFGANQGKYKVNSFKICESKIKNWLKLKGCNTLDDDEKEVLAAVLTRLKNEPDKKEKKNWADKGSNIWRNISIWLGDDWTGAPFD